MQFGRVDFAVFGIMLFLSTAIGIYHALTEGKRRTTKEFRTVDCRTDVCQDFHHGGNSAVWQS